MMNGYITFRFLELLGIEKYPAWHPACMSKLICKPLPFLDHNRVIFSEWII